MMVPEAYATVEEYRAHISKRDEGSDAEIELALRGISRHIDRRVGRQFARDEEPVRRRYYFRTSCWVPTADLSEEPEMVALGLPPDAPLDDVDSAEFGQDYRLYPSDALEDGLEPRPFEGLHFTAPRRNVPVDIVARWGWPQVPLPVQLATIEITAIWRLESNRATQVVNQLDQIERTSNLANSLVKDLIHVYRRSTFVVA